MKCLPAALTFMPQNPNPEAGRPEELADSRLPTASGESKLRTGTSPRGRKMGGGSLVSLLDFFFSPSQR